MGCKFLAKILDTELTYKALKSFCLYGSVTQGGVTMKKKNGRSTHQVKQVIRAYESVWSGMFDPETFFKKQSSCVQETVSPLSVKIQKNGYQLVVFDLEKAFTRRIAFGQ